MLLLLLLLGARVLVISLGLLRLIIALTLSLVLIAVSTPILTHKGRLDLLSGLIVDLAVPTWLVTMTMARWLTKHLRLLLVLAFLAEVN